MLNRYIYIHLKPRKTILQIQCIQYFMKSPYKAMLNLFIVMDFPMHVNRIVMKLLILHFKGSQVENS